MVLAHASDAPLGELLRGIQRDLFALGAQLADPKDRGRARARPRRRVVPEHVARLEKAIDAARGGLPPLTAFILPGRLAARARSCTWPGPSAAAPSAAS